MATDKIEIPVVVTVREEPSEAIALLRHFLFGEITPERVDRARRLLAGGGFSPVEELACALDEECVSAGEECPHGPHDDLAARLSRRLA